jgi:hypothetical protein
MKVKAIVYSDPEELEERINTVIDGKKIIDIKYLISPEVKVGDMTLFYAFIHYKEKETTLEASDY